MPFRNKIFPVITLAASVVVFSTAALAQDTTTATPTTPHKVERQEKGERREMREGKFGHEGFRGKHGDGMRMLRDLNLTEEQKTQIKSIREANKPNPETREQIRTLSRAKHDGTITAHQQAQLKALKTQMHAKGRSVHEQIEGVLTAEQKTQLKHRRHEMKQKFEERRETRTNKPATTDKPTIN